MRDLSTLAKLLAEEDIHVVHRNQSTAMFDVKNRELSLPIWKEMSKNIQDLMTLHEVGHALWTPLEQLEKARNENIEFSFVNVLEDVRIEKLVQKKYPGSVRVFNKGYKELIAQNFFETVGQDIAKYNLIDRINLHFKHHIDVPFSEEEKVWVQKANQTKTPDEVLDLAKELYEYIAENEESQGENLQDVSPNMSDMTMEGAQSENGIPSGSGSEGEEESEGYGDSGNTSDSKSEDEGSTPSAPANLDDEGSEESEEKTEAVIGGSEGGKDSDAPITASTDYAWNESSKQFLNNDGREYRTGFIPELDMKKIIVPSSTILDIFKNHYSDQVKSDGSVYSIKTLEEFTKTKNDSKKTIAYMVKEFEMKKSADQYARASTSKTGVLDMSALHTYKFNDDLFAKVTTLPGATNHGLVMFLDWSGSMSGNLKGTLNQLFNLIWFCKKVNIPFDVYAFSDAYYRNGNFSYRGGCANDFKPGDLKIDMFNLLHFFSSKMKNKDEMDMMHYLYMIASKWSYRDWRKEGYPYNVPRSMNLGGTPLNSAIVAALQVVPEFKKVSGVQKVHTIFLTDGASHKIGGVHKYQTHDGETLESYEGISGYGIGSSIYVDQKFGNKVKTDSYSSDRDTQMSALLDLLRKRVPDMSVTNFFVAGTGRKGMVKPSEVEYVMGYGSYIKSLEIAKKIRKENVGIVPKAQGFDTVFILPGLGGVDMDSELDVEVGASKAQLKRAFSKMSVGKIVNRPLLNNFIKMVA